MLTLALFLNTELWIFGLLTVIQTIR